MDIESIKITVDAVNKVCEILNVNYGDVDMKSLSEENLFVFLATAIEAGYRIGFIDGKGA